MDFGKNLRMDWFLSAIGKIQEDPVAVVTENHKEAFVILGIGIISFVGAIFCLICAQSYRLPIGIPALTLSIAMLVWARNTYKH